jgi:hypothetical protein
VEQPTNNAGCGLNSSAGMERMRLDLRFHRSSMRQLHLAITLRKLDLSCMVRGDMACIAMAHSAAAAKGYLLGRNGRSLHDGE